MCPAWLRSVSIARRAAACASSMARQAAIPASSVVAAGPGPGGASGSLSVVLTAAA